MPKSPSKRNSRVPVSPKPKPPTVRQTRAPKRHGTRGFVLKALAGTASGSAIGTKAVIKEVRSLAGKRIPEETIRSSLKTLVRQRLAKGRKRGHEKTYKLVAPEAATPPAVESTADVGRGEPRAEVTAAEIAVVQPLGPHKLAVGEVLIIEVGMAHVETATNLHGRVVLERHLRPK